VTVPLSFWAFSLAVYADPGVQAECLTLQDRDGVDVNLLLFCAYAGARHGVILQNADLRQAAEQVAKWQDEIVKPVRKTRRTLKSFTATTSPIASSAAMLLEQIKGLELEAERIEQAMLEDWGQERLRACQRAEPAAAIAANIRTLLTMHSAVEGPCDLPSRLVAASLANAGSGTDAD
jgi:uncharacterized protein (TIGR02444 family)